MEIKRRTKVLKRLSRVKKNDILQNETWTWGNARKKAILKNKQMYMIVSNECHTHTVKNRQQFYPKTIKNMKKVITAAKNIHTEHILSLWFSSK